MPDHDATAQAILEFVQAPEYRPMPLRELMHRMHVGPEGRPAFRRMVKDLLREGTLARVRGNRVGPGIPQQNVRGRLDRHPRGFGFVIPEGGGPDVFIPPRGFGDAVHGDVVAVRVTGRKPEGSLEGVIVEVLDRRSRRVYGLFRAEGRAGRVESFDPAFGEPVHIPGAFVHDARDGEAVSVEILRRPRAGAPAEGKVREVLGSPDRPGVDSLIVAKRHGLPLEFPDEVLHEAARLPAAVPADLARGRERFDDPSPVTIDGETARDFDDAVAVVPLPGGGWRLDVHIADVAAFVEPGSALDREARTRGTSVYFPDRVLPMFPERLSNDLCSLRPGEDRLVQSAVITFDREARVRSVRFADGVIRSAARLTYTQVAAALEGKAGHGVPKAQLPMLQSADALREALHRRRLARGSIDFDLPEPKILLDVEGAMTGVSLDERNAAHRLIEEFMLAANEAVAGHLEKREAPCLYRVHEAPDPLKLAALEEFVRGFGLKLTRGAKGIRPGDVRRLLEAAEGRPEYPVIAQVALRSMMQARYTTENLGHFGLASRTYAHFTSPIRRYPDLVVHRSLRAIRREDQPALARIADGLEAVGQACSTSEREAEQAEREVLEWKKIRFLAGREGERFDGIVVGVAPFGLFVQLREFLVEGLLRVERLGDDWFDHLPGRQELLGRQSGRAYRLGQVLPVVVTRVDTLFRRVDLALEGEESRERSREASAARPARGRKAGSEPAFRDRRGGKGGRRGGR